MVRIRVMSTESILEKNGICPECHTHISNTHTCIDDNVICTRFYTHEELVERAKKQHVQYVYIKKRVTTRPQTR